VECCSYDQGAAQVGYGSDSVMIITLISLRETVSSKPALDFGQKNVC
jgi:hypothetical protein